MGSGGHFIDRGSGTKPQLNGDGELSLECPLSLSHAVNRATGYYGTSADAGGDLFWQNDNELFTIGPFYAEDAEIRRTTVAELPSSHVVVAKRRLLTGVLGPTGEKFIYDDPAHPTRPSQVGVVPAGGGTILRVDTTDNEKLSAGLTGDQPRSEVRRPNNDSSGRLAARAEDGHVNEVGHHDQCQGIERAMDSCVQRA